MYQYYTYKDSIATVIIPPVLISKTVIHYIDEYFINITLMAWHDFNLQFVENTQTNDFLLFGL